MVQITPIIFPFFFPFSFPPPYRGRGNRGKTHSVPKRDKTGIAGKLECHNLLSVDLNT